VSEKRALLNGLRSAMVEVSALKSNLSDTKTDVAGLQKVHGSIVK
jgi:hypothetical protein